MDLDNKTILITGATGSFDKALIARILNEHDPAAIRLYSRDEFKQSELQRCHADEDRLRFLIGDGRDLPRLTRVNAGRPCDGGGGRDAAGADAALIDNLPLHQSRRGGAGTKHDRQHLRQCWASSPPARSVRPRSVSSAHSD